MDGGVIVLDSAVVTATEHPAIRAEQRRADRHTAPGGAGTCLGQRDGEHLLWVQVHTGILLPIPADDNAGTAPGDGGDRDR